MQERDRETNPPIYVEILTNFTNFTNFEATDIGFAN
jgi:hypothetical protein